MGVWDAARAVKPDFTEHGVWEGGEVRAEVSKDLGERDRLRKVREQPVKSSNQVGLWPG